MANVSSTHTISRKSRNSTLFRHRSRLPKSHPCDGTVLAPRKPIRIFGMIGGRELRALWPCCEARQRTLVRLRGRLRQLSSLRSWTDLCSRPFAPASSFFPVHPANACAGVCVWCPLVSEQCTRVRSYPPGGSGDQPSRHSVSLGARPRSGLHRGSRGRRSLEGAFFRGFVSMSCRRKLATCVFRDLRSAPDENGLRPFRESPQPTVRRPSNHPAKCYCANALRRRVRFNRMNLNNAG